MLSAPQTEARRIPTVPSRATPIPALCVLLAVAVGVLDSWSPLGVAIAALYSLVMAATILTRDPRVTRNTAVLCTAFVIAGALFSPESGVPRWIVSLNAVIFIAVVWATALLVMSRQRAAREIDEQHQLLERANRELARQAGQDGLTGIANRRAFDERLAVEAARANRANAPLSLLMIDVDQFKCYNDTAGHPAGDACLRALASAIRGVLRRPDDLAARYGGEEFAVLLPETSWAGALERAEEVCLAVRSLNLAHPGLRDAAHVTVSVGVHSAAPPVSAEQLLERADRNLYEAKLDGGGRVVGSR